MKKFLLVFAVAAFSGAVFAQTEFAQTENDLKPYAYCELVGTGRLMSTKVNVDIDFGQSTKLFSSNNKSRILDENGKPRKFNSMVDALNFMGSDGWEFVQAYVVTSGNQNVYRWLLRKSITQEELKNLEALTSKPEE